MGLRGLLRLIRFDGELRFDLVRRRLGDLRRPRALVAVARSLPGPLRGLPLWVPRVWLERFPVTDVRIVRDTTPFLGQGFRSSRVRFGHPYGVAVGGDGGFVIADTFKNRVLLFDPDGGLKGRIHHAREGRLSLVMPMCVALERDESILVLNTGQGALHRFGPRGDYRGDLWDTEQGRLIGARGLAVAPSGAVLVSDTRQHRVLALDRTGAPHSRLSDSELVAWPFAFPTGIAISSSGSIAICNTLRHQVEVFDAEGQHLRTIGGLGVERGRFNGPAACAFSSDDTLLVLEWAGNRVQAFGGGGILQGVWGKSGSWLLSRELGELSWAGGIAVDRLREEVWIADTHNHRIQRVPLAVVLSSEGPPAACAAESPPSSPMPARPELVPRRIRFMGDAPVGVQLKSPQGLIRVGPDAVWIADTFHNRLIRWHPERGEAHPLGRLGKGRGEFINPTDAAWVGDRVWVVDSLNSRLHEFSRAGTWLGLKNVGGLEYPRSITYCSEAGLAVSEQILGRIRVLDAAGEIRWEVERAGGHVSQPAWIRWHEGELYVADVGRHQVLVFSRAGKLVRSWGHLGLEAGGLNHPYALSIIEGSLCAVADAGNHRIQFYSLDGSWVRQWRGETEASRLFYPRGVLWMPGRRRLLVADSERHRLVELEVDL